MTITVIPKKYTAADFKTEYESGGGSELDLTGMTITNVQSDIEANRPVAGMIAGDVFIATDTNKLWLYNGSEWEDCKPPSILYITNALFQEIPATGTCVSPACLNNGSTADYVRMDVVNEYAEVEFPELCVITQFRYNGYAGHNLTGRWKIQHWDVSTETWVDNTINLPTNKQVWTDWADLTKKHIVTNKIRFVATTLDTSTNESKCRQLEMRVVI